MHLDDQGAVESYREHLSMAKKPRWIEQLSSNFKQTKTFSMDQESVEKLSRQIPESFDGLKMR